MANFSDIFAGAAGGGGITRVDLTTVPSPFNVPAGVTSLTVYGCGGGGGGGAGDGGDGAGGGGGAGAALYTYQINVTPGESIAYLIGDGGAGGSPADGSAGLDSTFGNAIFTGGDWGHSLLGVGGTAGGTGIDGGADGGNPALMATWDGGVTVFSTYTGGSSGSGSSDSGAGGGAGPFGDGADGGVVSVNVKAPSGGSNTGAGGGGGEGSYGTDGGDGGSGRIIVEYVTP